jgi:hypothetical protein
MPDFQFWVEQNIGIGVSQELIAKSPPQFPEAGFSRILAPLTGLEPVTYGLTVCLLFT